MYNYDLKASVGQKVFAVIPEVRFERLDKNRFSGYLFFSCDNIITGNVSYYVISDDGRIEYAINLEKNHENDDTVTRFIDQHFCFTTVEGLVKFMSFVSRFESTQLDFIRKDSISNYPFYTNVILCPDDYDDSKMKRDVFNEIISAIYHDKFSKMYFKFKGTSIFEEPKMVFKSVKPIRGWFEPSF